MADNKVKFLRGTSNEYAVAEKDSDTIYFTTDDGKLYIGDKEVSGDGSITIDDTLSDTSTNPVQNKVVKQAIDNKADKSLYGDTTINVGRKAGTTVGKYSTAEGRNITASSWASHAEGEGTTASSDYSHAEGKSTAASGLYSHAEGRGTTASGAGSHAEGSMTTASGSFSSHAEGANTTASGDCSHAEGSHTTASGANSHAGGIGTKALHDNEVAYGKYNESNDNTLFSIGNGTADDARHNAFEITTAGGKLHDKDIATTDLIPSTLPANGGTAYTISEWGATRVCTDLDNTELGFSAAPGDAIGAPNTFWSTILTTGQTELYRTQIAFPWGYDGISQKVKYRSKSNGIWSEWGNINDGGNADTVDGLHANDFTQIIDFGESETDTKTAIGQPGKTAIYRCSKWTDYPSGCHDGQGTVIAINYNGVGTAGVNIMWVKQIFLTAHYDAPLFHIRWVDDTRVGKWEEISTTPIKSTGWITTPTDAYGTIVLPNSSSRRYLSTIVVGCYSQLFMYNDEYTVHVMDGNFNKITNSPVTYIAFYIE